MYVPPNSCEEKGAGAVPHPRGPPVEKLTALREFLFELGVQLAR